MATPTYTELLAEYKTALMKISVGGQSYKIGPRELTRANLSEVRKTINWLENQIAREGDTTEGFGLASFGGPI